MVNVILDNQILLINFKNYIVGINVNIDKNPRIKKLSVFKYIILIYYIYYYITKIKCENVFSLISTYLSKLSIVINKFPELYC